MVLMLRLLSSELTTKAISLENEIPKSEVILNGQATRKFIVGVVLEAAIGWQDYYLLMLTDDILHEDMLSIHLLDKNLNILDSVTLGAIYSTGSFSSLELNEPDRVNFRFIDNADWEIELLEKPVFAMPLLFEPSS